jgi:hypothetical protein
MLVGMPEKRPSNSELRLLKLEEEEPKPDQARGIFELFERDEDAALSRDDDSEEPS